jgi:hypothetical protein
MPAQDDANDRRGTGDRREGGTGKDRRGKKPTSALVYVLRSLGAIVVLVGVIAYTATHTHPLYVENAKVGKELRKLTAAVPAANLTTVDKLTATPEFQAEKRKFFEDIMRMRQVDSARADSIAQFAVREAYVRGVSPAIIFGVMLTENSRFISKAKSNVGAVGLMQVYPKIWLNKEMSALLGKDLAEDSTNVKYGVFILKKYFNPKNRAGVVQQRDWQTALLRYNGCVKGTNTPRCFTYPSKVKNFVEGSARSICSGKGFYDCIAKPFIKGFIGDETAVESSAAGEVVPAPQPAVPTK